MKLSFKKADHALLPLIFAWLDEPHMREFWDNSEEHRQDIVNFINGNKQTYFAGTTKYWVGFCDDQPFCFVLSDEIDANEPDLFPVYRRHLSKTGTSIGLDFGIGSPAHMGKGLAAPTLRAFMSFYRSAIDKQADTFFIDPAITNPRARHVYEKAGFQVVGDYDPTEGAFVGEKSLLMVKTVKGEDN